MEKEALQQLFVKEKVKEQFEKMGMAARTDMMNRVIHIIQQDEQFWKLLDSLFASYIDARVGSEPEPLRNAL